MGRIQFVSARVGAFHCKSYPVPEVQIFPHDWSELNSKFRRRVEEKGSTRFDDPATLGNPFSAPLHIVALLHLVVIPVPVILADVERRVCKYGVNGFCPHVPEHLKAIGVIEHAMRCCEKRFQHKKDSLVPLELVLTSV